MKPIATKFKIIDGRFVVDRGIDGVLVAARLHWPDGMKRRAHGYVWVPGLHKRYTSIVNNQRERFKPSGRR